MKQKNWNKINLSVNFILVVVFLVQYLLGVVLKFKVGIKVESSVYGIIGEYERLMLSFKIGFAIMLGISIISMIQNRENKKQLFWYSILSMGYALIILTFLWGEINQWIKLLLDWGIAFLLPIGLAIKNMVTTIKEDGNKKKIILYIAVMIYVIVDRLWINEYAFGWALIAIIMLFIYNKQTGQEEKRNQRIINVLLSIITLGTLFYVIIMLILLYVNLYRVDGETVKFFNEIKTNLEKADVNEEDRLIRVSKNGKVGAINERGEEVIPCEYDAVEVRLDMPFAMVVKEKEYKIIANNGIVLGTCMERPTPYFSDELFEEKDWERNGQDCIFMAAVTIKAYIGDNSTTEDIVKYVPYYSIIPDENGEYAIKSNKEEYRIQVQKKVQPNLEKVWEMNHQQSLQLNNTQMTTNQGALYKEYNAITYQVKKMSDNTIQEIAINLTSNKDTDDNMEQVNVLQVYSDGYIPYYNLKEKTQGYYDRNLNLHTLAGNYQILDIRDDMLLAEEFDENHDAKRVVALNLLDGTTKEYKGVQTLKEGYLVKKDNDKIVCLDRNFKEISDEYEETYFYQGEYLLDDVYHEFYKNK